MAKLIDVLSRIRITYRRSGNATKVMVIVTIIVCMGALSALRLSIHDLENRTADLRQFAAQLEDANVQRQEDIDQLGSMKSVVEIAEEELNLVQPGTIIFKPAS